MTQSDRAIQVSTRRGGALETLTAEHVVCAIPRPVIGKIFEKARLSDAKKVAVRELNYSRTVEAFLQSRTRFWLNESLSGSVVTDLPIERISPDPGADHDGRGTLAAYTIGPYTAALENMTEEGRVAETLGQVRQIFPKLGESFEGGISHCWGLDPWQRGSFALHSPGQIGFIKIQAQPEGRIHFAGEHTSHWTG